MDTFMLFCNLHADGPATRERLRQAGCGSLEELARMPAAELSRLLETSPAGAERLQRQAHGLSERFAASPLEPEVDAQEGAALAPPRIAAIPSAQPAPTLASPLASVRAQVARVAAEATRPPLPASRTEPLRPGLFAGLDGAWCRKLAEHDVFTLESLAGIGVRKLARQMQVSYPQLLELQLLAFRQVADRGQPGGARPTSEPAPAPGAEPPGERLEPGSLPHLGPELCAKLLEHGIRKPAELAQASTLSLARALGVPYIRVLELQVQARQQFADVIVPQAPPSDRRPGEPSSPARRVAPAAGPPIDPDPGGPFA